MNEAQRTSLIACLEAGAAMARALTRRCRPPLIRAQRTTSRHSPLPTTILLIDLQNRRPAAKHVAAWMGSDGEAWIFYGHEEIGALWETYLSLGPQVSIVPILRPGNNSLDFHLVLYLGYLVAKREPGTRFVIVAADSDYDAAVDHARLEGVDVIRIADLKAPPMQVSANKTSAAIVSSRLRLHGGRRRHSRTGPTGPSDRTHEPHRVPPRFGGLARRC